MAAVVLITVYGSNGATISLVCSKTKVAPLKRLTIPRLELTAALLLSRLMQYVQATLKLNVTATHLWTDSVVTLTWIKSHAPRWKDFVRNRVSQIQELTANAHWKYVPGTSNPADCASRGLSTAQLQSHSLWWTGPPWILTPEAWPSQPALSDELSAHEARPGIALHAAASQPDYHWDLIYRFISLLRKRRYKPLDLHSVLEEARLFWIKATQAAYFTQEIKMLTANSRLPTAHAFSRLTAYIDAQGIIRQAISKWHHPNNNIKMGSIVLLTDERSPPCKWPLARVTALHPSKDGLTRVVTLKTATRHSLGQVPSLPYYPFQPDKGSRVRNHQQGC
ncbi:uncharacterized protein LOC112467525 [Temnothorax curvispinosus]|uniref:Uncharacterized protein LOC112467525 n=1 Tax=Temnothorax curvispinosus TaxID=300111 RepID=A0A6J1RGL1_9HYME|nr:uncharacterized protein LOC112467525 [Temnothorax curvispinosus]